jgi:hypothetical protein
MSTKCKSEDYTIPKPIALMSHNSSMSLTIVDLMAIEQQGGKFHSYRVNNRVRMYISNIMDIVDTSTLSSHARKLIEFHKAHGYAVVFIV